MEYLVFRPYWNVPYSITVEELIPKIKQDPWYLYDHNYEILNGHTVVSSGFFDQMMANGLRAGKLRIRQKPGGSNALGLIKFIFPNSNSVYLHDTPTRHLFSRSRRDFSHGCIRVENPVALAEFVLGLQGQGWDRTTIDRAMEKGANDQKVALRERIPVHIFYTTAIVRENGDIAFFDDIYGHDKRLSQLLNSVQRREQN
jgi:murein L,D-transpeptidase YcbB/YkuD